MKTKKLTCEETGRQGGKARSEAKIQAAKLNGAKGGRPRKPKQMIATLERDLRDWHAKHP